MRSDDGASRDLIFEGVIPAVMTPFGGDALEIDVGALRVNVATMLESGVRDVVVCGTMGEAGALSDSERERVISTAVETIGERGRVTVGVSAVDARTAAERARQAQASGGQGVMCLSPLNYAADELEVLRFFEEVSSATDLPLMLYNNPAASRNDLGPQQIARVVRSCDRIVAVKECSGDARRIAAALELIGGDAEVLVGGDDWALEGFCAGATGWISGCANVAPAECVRLHRLCRDGDLARARALYERLLPLARLDMHPKLVQFFKAAVDRRGGHGGPTRPPRRELTPPEVRWVEAAVAPLDRISEPIGA